MSLKIARDFSCPLHFLEHRKVVLGGSGTGKTAFGRVLFEEATKAGVVCGAIDLKADWWGLKSSADGKRDGIPVVIFGGEHQDVPLDEGGGAATADIVVDLRQPFNRLPLAIFWDEIDRYAPQKPMSPEANICLGAMEDIAKRGRKHGIFSTFITQRNAGLNKGVSELCDVAVVTRTPGPRDQEAVEDWFATNATREQMDAVMKGLAGLDTGMAVICCAHPKMKLFKTVQIRMPETFDSSATPAIGRRRIVPKKLAQPDLKLIQARMVATIKKAKSEDPKELRKELATRLLTINDLNARICELEQRSEKQTKAVTVEVPAVKDGQIKRLEALAEKLTTAGRILIQEFMDFRLAVAMLRQKTVAPASDPVPARAHTPPPVRTTAQLSDGGKLRRSQQHILNALVFAEGIGRPYLEKAQLALLADQSPTSGGYFNNLGALRTASLIEYPSPSHVMLTPGGRTLAEPVDIPTTSEALHAMLEKKLSASQGAILRALIVTYPKEIGKSELAERTGQSPTSGGYFNNLGRLRSLGLIDYPRPGYVVAKSALFLESR